MKDLVVWSTPETLMQREVSPGFHHLQAASWPALRSSLWEAAESSGEFLGMIWFGGRVEVSPHAWQRCRSAADSGADLIYGDYRTPQELVRTLDSEPGSLREEFDTGPLWCVQREALRAALSELPDAISSPSAVRYGLRLAFLRGRTSRLPEPLTQVQKRPGDDLFGYVRADARIEQAELETVLTDHLRRIGAWLPPRTAPYGDDGPYPVHASVVIPVRNRARTIGDAVASALHQKTGFSFNVLVVDNHSADGTPAQARQAAGGDARLHVIIPDRHDLGIGGCWNVASCSPLAGRFLVQLDSDDVYASDQSLHTMVTLIDSGPWAMAVGAYTTVDMAGREVSPGLVDHREWTAENGHNNLLRVSGIGAPRTLATAFVRAFPFPNVSYGEDYSMALQVSRRHHVARTHECVYLARRWEGNTDHCVRPEVARDREAYKNRLRTMEILARAKEGTL